LCFRFLVLGQRHFAAQKTNALPSRPRRFAVRAVKAAQFAFIGAERRALTEEADGEAQSFGGKSSSNTSIHKVFESVVAGFLRNADRKLWILFSEVA